MDLFTMQHVQASVTSQLLRTKLFPHNMTKYSFLPHFLPITELFSGTRISCPVVSLSCLQMCLDLAVFEM